MKKRLMTGLLVFSLIFESGVVSLHADEEVPQTEMRLEEALETETETESETYMELQTEPETVFETELPAPAESETELQNVEIKSEQVVVDAQLKAFYDLDAGSLVLVFKSFGDNKSYRYTLYDAEKNEQLQTGDLQIKPYEDLNSALIKLDEKAFTDRIKAVRIEISCDGQVAQVLVDSSVNTAQSLNSEATSGGDIQLQWDAVQTADGYVVLALSEDDVKLYEALKDSELEMKAPEDASYTVMMAAYDTQEEDKTETLVAFSPVVTVKVEAADVQLTAEETETVTETETETAAQTDTAAPETEAPVLLEAANAGPQKAVDLKASAYEKSAKLSWTKAKGTDGYRIWVFDVKTGKRILQVYETGSEYKVTDLAPDTEYMFKLRAYNVVKGKKVFGPMSEAVSFSTKHFVPAVAKNIKVSAGETTAKITWTKGARAHGYYLSVYDVETDKRIYTTRTTGTSCNISGLTIGKQYRYVLRGYRKVDGVIYRGNYSEKYLFKTDYITPAKASGLKAVPGDLSVALTWKKATNATHYYIQVRDDATGKISAAGRTRNLKYTVEGLENKKEYSFRVLSYRLVNKHTTYAKATGWVKAVPVLQAPSAPTSLDVKYTDDGNVLTWSNVKKANGYVVYSYDYDAKKNKKVATVTDNTWTDKGNGESGKFKYSVKAFRKEDGKTLYSPAISKLVYGNREILAASEIHPILYSGKMNQTTTLYTTQSGSQTAGKISAGTAVTCSYRTHSGRNRIILSDGSTYWVKPSSVSCYSDHYTSKDYSKAAKETFLNNGGYSSNSKYFVWVSTYTQRVNIFTGSQGNWKLLLTSPCATGVVATFTPHGKGVLKSHQRTFYAEYSYYEWLTYFTSGNAFHTRIKKNSDGSFRSRTLGKPMSGGCVRVKDDIARMIYYDIPLKTGELIY